MYGAGLAQRLNRAIELRIVEVAPSDHHANRAIARIERKEGALQVRRCSAALIAFAMRDVMLESLVRVWPESARFDGARLALERPFGCALLVEIERGVDLEALFVQLLAKLCIELLPHPFDEVRRGFARRGLVGELERIGLRPARVCGVDLSALTH
jgi:hypothetical protein